MNNQAINRPRGFRAVESVLPRGRKKPETAAVELRIDRGGRLQIKRGEDWVNVAPVRCFPWSQAGRYISLRNEDNEELGLITSVDDLQGETRWALLRALDVAGFLLEVVGVESIAEDFEIRVWRVRTSRGPRSFQTELDAWPHPSPGGGHMIEDVAGDVFFIPPLESLDTESRRKLWPYVE